MKLRLIILMNTFLFAGVVNPNFYYQDYLDFGTNKGKFKADENISVTDKYGKTIDFKVPMPDFSAANQSGALMSELTNIGGSYAITAAHMISPSNKPYLIKKDKTLEFGNVKSQVVASDTDFKDYWIYNNNCQELKENSGLLDFAVVKMSKLNINKSAKLIETEFFYKEKNLSEEQKNDQVLLYQDKFYNKFSPNYWDNDSYKEYIANSQEIDSNDIGKGILINNPQRFSVYARSGSGMQRLGYLDGKLVPQAIEDDGIYLSGGILYLNTITSKDTARVVYIDAISENKIYDDGNYDRLDFSNSSAPGDSGSAIYVYDNLLKSWLVVGVMSKSDCNPELTTGFNCTTNKYALINHHIINDFKNDFTKELDGNVYNSIDINNNIKDKFYENNKDLKFNGKTTINLNLTSENLGSSVFYFNDDSSINGGEVLLGGVVIDENKTLDFNAQTKLNDNLHKMGKGILNINIESLGGLRTGEGETWLNTNGKAFNSVYLLNDAVLKIKNANQIDLDSTIFNGGTLDLNGVSLNANTIKANDIRTKIINSGSALSSISLNEKAIYHGQIGKNIDVKIGANDVVFDGALDINSLSLSSGKAILQGHPLTHSKVFALEGNSLVGDVYTATSVKLEQDDWEQREFNIEKIHVLNSSLDILKHATLNANEITLESSSLNIGENTAYIDGHDGHNIVSDTFYQSTFTSGSSTAKDIFVNANVFLSANSNLNIKNNSNFNGNISDDGSGSLNLENANIDANINVANLNAKNTRFKFGLANTLKSNISTTGDNNTFIIKPDLINGFSDKYLLASLKGIDNENYLKALKYKDNISIYTPNIKYVYKDNTANWYLASINSSPINPEQPAIPENPTIKDYFFVKENTEAIDKVDTSLNQVFFSYVLEWNNLQKRIGELRNTANENAGIWARFYTGGSSYLNSSKTKFYELQFGADKVYHANSFTNFSGILFNFSDYKLSNNIDGNIKGIGFGIYNSMLFNNGFYIDFITKYINYKNDFKIIVNNENDIVNTLNSKNNSFAIVSSLELGYRMFLNKSFYIEPEIELITGYVNKQNLQSDDKKLQLSAKSFIPLSAKGALFTGLNGNKTNYRLGLGVATDILKSSNKKIKDLNIEKELSGKKDTRMFINLSSSYNLNDTSNINLEFERTFFGDFDIDYSFNLIYRKTF